MIVTIGTDISMFLICLHRHYQQKGPVIITNSIVYSSEELDSKKLTLVFAPGVIHSGLTHLSPGFRISIGDFSVLNLFDSYSFSPLLVGVFIILLYVPMSEHHTNFLLSALQALIDILCLDSLAIGMMCSWYRINKVATLLMVPYLGWLAMATCLTIRIWKDNPEQKPGKSE